MELNNMTLIEVEQVTKQFGEVLANDQVSLTLKAGEIHAVLGENGAGKSTLMKMLYGLYPPDDGKVRIEGKEVSLYPPSHANRLGIRMVFQQFTLIPSLTVLENILLFLSKRERAQGKTALRNRIETISSQFGLKVKPDVYVWEMDLGERQRVEILKALIGESVRLIIFDEPTSVLTPIEVQEFLSMLKQLSDNGMAVLLITHKIQEVLTCAHRATVLRAGRVVRVVEDVSMTTREELIEAMLGSQTPTQAPEVSELEETSKILESPVVLELDHLSVQNDHGRTIVASAELSLRAGEIAGIAGISGNGQRELLEAIFGLRKIQKGVLKIEGKEFKRMNPAALIESGVSLLPEDPIRDSVVPNLTVLEHMVLGGITPPHKRMNIDWANVRESLEGQVFLRSLQLAPWNRFVETLSGGNVQRVILARGMLSNPKILLLSYPTRGLDIALVRTVHRLVRDLKKQGCAILYLSEDLSELYEISDSLYVLGNGKLTGPYLAGETDPMEIGRIMVGEEVRK